MVKLDGIEIKRVTLIECAPPEYDTIIEFYIDERFKDVTDVSKLKDYEIKIFKCTCNVDHIDFARIILDSKAEYSINTK